MSSNLVRSFLSNLGILIKSKWLFFPPKAKNILIFDGHNNPFMKYFKSKEVDVLYVRGEKINIYVLLTCLIKGKFYSKAYYQEYIKNVRPKIILTFIDNAPRFYLIKNLTGAKTAFVQNGIRSHWCDIFGQKNLVNPKNKKKFCVDYMFVFNSKIGKKYNSFIQGKYIVIGSFKNNMIKIKTRKKKREILLISTFRIKRKNKILSHGKTWKEFTKNDDYFFSWLSKASNKEKINVNILGARAGKNGIEELNYYNNFFRKNNFKFIAKYPGRDTYKILDTFEFVFTIDSTLGIENLTRNGKSGFFGNRPNIYPINTRKFGWMENFPSEGPFWTYSNNIKKFQKVFNFVIKGKNKSWRITRNKYVPKIMEYDPGNNKFRETINKIISKK